MRSAAGSVRIAMFVVPGRADRNTAHGSEFPVCHCSEAAALSGRYADYIVNQRGSRPVGRAARRLARRRRSTVGACRTRSARTLRREVLLEDTSCPLTNETFQARQQGVSRTAWQWASLMRGTHRGCTLYVEPPATFPSRSKRAWRSGARPDHRGADRDLLRPLRSGICRARKRHRSRRFTATRVTSEPCRCITSWHSQNAALR